VPLYHPSGEEVDEGLDKWVEAKFNCMLDLASRCTTFPACCVLVLSHCVHFLARKAQSPRPFLQTPSSQCLRPAQGLCPSIVALGRPVS